MSNACLFRQGRQRLLGRNDPLSCVPEKMCSFSCRSLDESSDSWHLAVVRVEADGHQGMENMFPVPSVGLLFSFYYPFVGSITLLIGYSTRTI